MTKKLFGTDGIRGLANHYPMTPEIALSLGEAIAFYFARKKGGGRIVIGKDTRRSSYLFEYALSAGISSMGSQAILTGPLPTPGIAFIIRAMRADAGVVISASHNAFCDNGIKFFDQQGYKLPDEVESQMEEFIFSTQEDSIKPTGGQIGRAIRVEDAAGRYAEFLKSTFPKNLNLKGIKVVIDCAHGAAYNVGPMVLSEMDADVITMGVEPNGTNINDNCGALYPAAVAERVVKEKAQLGIALDGDADRVILCDEKGHIVDGDQILALCAVAMEKEEQLAHKTVVGTIMNNMGLQVYLKDKGIDLIRTSVGDRFVSEEMRKHGYTLGGEPSGHLIFGDLSTTGDGLIGGLQVLAAMLKNKRPLSELVHQIPLFCQVSKNIPVKSKKILDQIEPLQKEIRGIEADLKGRGRVVLRYSGTEGSISQPVLRLMIEGEEEQKLQGFLARLSSCIQENL